MSPPAHGRDHAAGRWKPLARVPAPPGAARFARDRAAADMEPKEERG